jgi:RNA polymerase sigma factor (sigma-70 family)
MWPENPIYEQWRNASEDERPAIKEKLAEHLTEHFRKAALKKYGEINEDAVQKGVIAALENIGKFEGRNALFSTWSHRIGLNKMFDVMKERKRDREMFVSMETLRATDDEEQEPPWDPPDPATLPDPVPKIDYERKRETLTVRERQVWDLHDEGYSEQDIADILRISIDAVESRLRRARKKLQKN